MFFWCQFLESTPNHILLKFWCPDSCCVLIEARLLQWFIHITCFTPHWNVFKLSKWDGTPPGVMRYHHSRHRLWFVSNVVNNVLQGMPVLNQKDSWLFWWSLYITVCSCLPTSNSLNMLHIWETWWCFHSRILHVLRVLHACTDNIQSLSSSSKIFQLDLGINIRLISCHPSRVIANILGTLACWEKYSSSPQIISLFWTI